LWICLLCGNIGCGRYKGGHAHDHFVNTQHTFSLELETQRVWDYMGDNYVHRLIQNKSDGKLVELSGPPGSEDFKDEVLESKRTALALEYTHLLTTQLETQREYFEGEMKHIQKENGIRIKDLEGRLKNTLEEKERLHKDVNSLEKAKKTSHKKIEKLEKTLSAMKKEMDFLQEVHKSLTENQEILKTKLEEANSQLQNRDEGTQQRVKDLEDQVRDLMFFIEGKKKIEAMGDSEEVREGTILIAENPQKTRRGRPRRARGGGK